VDSPLANIERRDSFAIIRLGPSEKTGALSSEMVVTLKQSFQNLEKQPDLRAIILTEVGDTKSSADTDVAKSADITPSEVREDYQERQELYDQITKCNVPVIVALDGLTAGEFLELILACHLRIASSNASFRFPEVRLESNAGKSAVQRLACEIGNEHALEICRSGKTVLAEEALRMGLINRIAPAGRLLIEAESLARLISTMAPLAIRACLEAVTRGVELPLADGLDLEAQLFASLFATNDVREGTSAFLEKRRPVFKQN
jgi:enoyl-CoA hydratase